MTSPAELSALVSAALPASAPLREHPALAVWLAQSLNALPVQLDAVDASWLAGRLATTTAEQLDERSGPELVLVAACLAGDARAQEAFDVQLRAEVRRAVTPMDTTNALVDEVTQLVRERLLVGEPKRLGDFSGEGSLASWLRAVAVRLAFNAKRPGAREDPVDVVPDQPLADPDPELALLRARYREQFKAAFTDAVRALSPRERTLMRLTHLDGLTLARIGQMYGKDASTVSRWLAAARQALLEQTRAKLAETLKLTTSELDSVMRAADSQLDLSLSVLLKSQAAERDP